MSYYYKCTHLTLIYTPISQTMRDAPIEPVTFKMAAGEIKMDEWPVTATMMAVQWIRLIDFFSWGSPFWPAVWFSTVTPLPMFPLKKNKKNKCQLVCFKVYWSPEELSSCSSGQESKKKQNEELRTPVIKRSMKRGIGTLKIRRGKWIKLKREIYRENIKLNTKKNFRINEKQREIKKERKKNYPEKKSQGTRI